MASTDKKATDDVTKKKERTDRKDPDYYDRSGTKLLLKAMERAEVDFEKLSELLVKEGYVTFSSAKTLKQKVDRGTFGMGFGLLVLRLLRQTEVDLTSVDLVNYRENRRLTEKWAAGRAERAARMRKVRQALLAIPEDE